jgi:hypothetical protein
MQPAGRKRAVPLACLAQLSDLPSLIIQHSPLSTLHRSVVPSEAGLDVETVIAQVRNLTTYRLVFSQSFLSSNSGTETELVEKMK